MPFCCCQKALTSAQAISSNPGSKANQAGTAPRPAVTGRSKKSSVCELNMAAVYPERNPAKPPSNGF